MSDFSRSPLELLLESRQRGYVGLHVEQGVPLLDRDLNLLQDLIVAGVRSLFTRYVGDGVPAGEDAFAVAALDRPQDFRITAGMAGGPGSILVQGMEIPIPAPVDYSAQAGAAALTTPAGPDVRVDVVYLDAWLDEIDGASDVDLTNADDVGMQTSTRILVRWAVRVAEGGGIPALEPGHVSCPLAELRRPPGVATVTADMITDRRQRGLTLSDLEQRLALMERVLLLPAFADPPTPEFTPVSDIAGRGVTVNGVNLDVAGVEVLFGDRVAARLDTPTPTSMLVAVPSGLTPDGRPVLVSLTLRNHGRTAVSRKQFRIRPVPDFADPGRQFAPTHAKAGAEVRIAGFNFNAGPITVTFGSVAATVVGTPTNTEVVVQVPDGLVPAGQTSADVKIVVRIGPDARTSTDTFRAEVSVLPPVFVVPPNPQFTPQQGVAGAPVTLNGENFAFSPAVTFDDKPATVVGSPTATQLVVAVPADLVPAGQQSKRYFITVTTPGGAATSAEQFTVRRA